MLRYVARAVVAAIAASVLVLSSGCTTQTHVTQAQPIAEPAPTSARAPQRPLARLEPADGTYFGVSLDWAQDTVAAYARRLGRTPSAFVAFAHFPVEPDDEAGLAAFFTQVQQAHGLALLTIEPTIPLHSITAAMSDSFADRLAEYNAAGVPVLVRFAHEMNGSWYLWSQQPNDYVAAFRTVALAVHARANRSAMLWAPNYGAGYPFTGGAYTARPGTAEYATLDTNHDGIVDARDDMYAPYYPGDDAVDWVGMTLYHWGDAWPWGKNVVPEPGKFESELGGTYNGIGGDQRGLPNFYTEYAEGHGKPMAIPETAALYNPNAPGGNELEIKQGWWRQVFGPNIPERFPMIKLIDWFEWRKYEQEIDGVVDWTSTESPPLQQAFAADLPVWLRLGPSQAIQASPEAGATQTSGGLPAMTEANDSARRLTFAGLTWRVRASPQLEGPGPNYFADDSDTAWIDDAGSLHLRVHFDVVFGHWVAAEVTAEQPMGYGTYTFEVDSPLDQLDPNVVLGLFTWSDDPAEDHRELDIEFARFGRPDALAGRHTKQPYTEPGNVVLFTAPTAPETTHTINWTSGRAEFETRARAGGEVARGEFTREVPRPGDARVHINLWLDAGRAPTNGEPVDVVVRSFNFVPAAAE